ncbi:NADPH-dependent FMN reductase [Candidatus Koribacter versatilis Ellin345]|uniref:NADPH-dependent FMN reductase n=1 Tax=Koribacter versatilis (strain Ellin345) TaxID=204669 RepID=Q1IJH7_KORVE|nr:NAD(P)H-dependent oxidoreductase [Candidatus Koribacter versatilis]ABF42973.1 NADPH-dependent FMN reductase [Candidatus Koribacter versatilis Ellin345]
MTDTVRVALIYGSTRTGRLCDKVAGWAAKQIARTGNFAIETIDPAATPMNEIREGLAASDAIVVVTPEYNHGYPAPLKQLIDSFNTEWHAKPVAFVSYGGMSGGIRAVEQLRQVFVELHAMTVRDGVTFPNAWQQFETETPQDSARAERSMAVMLERLHWWAIALRIARTATPYTIAA